MKLVVLLLIRVVLAVRFELAAPEGGAREIAYTDEAKNPLATLTGDERSVNVSVPLRTPDVYLSDGTSNLERFARLEERISHLEDENHFLSEHIQRLLNVTFAPAPPPPPPALQFVGCFNDQQNFDEQLTRYCSGTTSCRNNNIIDECTYQCITVRGYRYAMIEHGNHCQCGNSPPPTQIGDSGCSCRVVNCAQNSEACPIQWGCGGPHIASVWMVG